MAFFAFRPHEFRCSADRSIVWAGMTLTGGTTYFDASSYHRNIGISGSTIIGTPWGPAMNYNGGNHLATFDGPHLRLARYSLHTWVRVADFSGYRQVISKGAGTSRNFYLTINITDGRPYAGHTSSASFLSALPASKALTANRWTFLCSTYDGTNIRLMMGDEAGWYGVIATLAAGTPDTQSNDLYIGRTNGTDDGMVGQIEAPVIRSEAITEAKALTLFSDTFREFRTRRSVGFLTSAQSGSIVPLASYHYRRRRVG